MLTEKGRDLLPIVESMRHYGRRWLCEELSSHAEQLREHDSAQNAVAA